MAQDYTDKRTARMSQALGMTNFGSQYSPPYEQADGTVIPRYLGHETGMIYPTLNAVAAGGGGTTDFLIPANVLFKGIYVTGTAAAGTFAVDLPLMGSEAAVAIATGLSLTSLAQVFSAPDPAKAQKIQRICRVTYTGATVAAVPKIAIELAPAPYAWK